MLNISFSYTEPRQKKFLENETDAYLDVHLSGSQASLQRFNEAVSSTATSGAPEQIEAIRNSLKIRIYLFAGSAAHGSGFLRAIAVQGGLILIGDKDAFKELSDDIGDVIHEIQQENHISGYHRHRELLDNNRASSAKVGEITIHCDG